MMCHGEKLTLFRHTKYIAGNEYIYHGLHLNTGKLWRVIIKTYLPWHKYPMTFVVTLKVEEMNWLEQEYVEYLQYVPICMSACWHGSTWSTYTYTMCSIAYHMWPNGWSNVDDFPDTSIVLWGMILKDCTDKAQLYNKMLFDARVQYMSSLTYIIVMEYQHFYLGILMLTLDDVTICNIIVVIRMWLLLNP